MGEIILKQIHTGTSEYDAELKLRDDILRRPLGLCLFDENLSAEADDIHIGAFAAGELAGVLVLAPFGTNSLKMRQVAVSADKQKCGIGTQMVEYAERFAAQKGFIGINLHARKTAVGFYERLGYTVMGEEFSEIGISHRAMAKRIK